jgi:hypothetical protein
MIYPRQFFDFQTNTFPQRVWRNFLDHWPDHQVMTPYSDGKGRSLQDAGRFGTYIIGYRSNKDLQKLNADSRAVISQFSNEYLKPAIAKKLANYFPLFEARFGARLSDVELDVFAVLVNAQKEINVRIHTENPSIILTGLIYVVDDNFTYPTTAMYSCKDPAFLDCGNTFYDFDQFLPIFEPPSFDNSMLTFAKTDRSFHGVEKQAIPNNRFRKSINWHVRLTDESIKKIYGVDSLRNIDNSHEQFMQDMQAEPGSIFSAETLSQKIISQAFQHMPTM